MDWVLDTEGDSVEMFRGKRNSSGHHCMSGACSIEQVINDLVVFKL